METLLAWAALHQGVPGLVLAEQDGLIAIATSSQFTLQFRITLLPTLYPLCEDK